MLLTNRATAWLCLDLSLIYNCGVYHSTFSTVGSTIQWWWIATSPGPQLGSTIATSTVGTVCICWPHSPISIWNIKNSLYPNIHIHIYIYKNQFKSTLLIIDLYNTLKWCYLPTGQMHGFVCISVWPAIVVLVIPLAVQLVPPFSGDGLLQVLVLNWDPP